MLLWWNLEQNRNQFYHSALCMRQGLFQTPLNLRQSGRLYPQLDIPFSFHFSLGWPTVISNILYS